MAIFHLSVKTVSRATGRSAVAAAAYRTATAIEDERLGQRHDYTRKRGVEVAFIVAPDEAAWTAERSALWNAVEAAEKRKDAKVAREYELALPHELDRGGRERLVRAFAGEVVARFGVAADVAIHAPGREGDQRIHHAHVLTTTRSVTAEGMGAKTRELDVKQTSGPAIEALRELWAVQVNHALERIHAEARIDHRSLEGQGQPDQVPTQHMGSGATALERQAARKTLPAPAGAAAVVEHQQPDPAAEPLAPVEPVNRIGQHNAEVRERNRLLEAARQVMELAREQVGELERVARTGVRKVMGLARGLGASIAAERQRQAEERVRQEQERQRAEAVRQARVLQAAELARQEQVRQAIATQQQRDEARLKATAQKQTPADAQQNVTHSQPRTGPRMER